MLAFALPALVHSEVGSYKCARTTLPSRSARQNITLTHGRRRCCCSFGLSLRRRGKEKSRTAPEPSCAKGT